MLHGRLVIVEMAESLVAVVDAMYYLNAGTKLNDSFVFCLC